MLKSLLSGFVAAVMSALFVVVAVCVPRGAVSGDFLRPDANRSAPSKRGAAIGPEKRGQITLYPILFGDPVAAGITAGPDRAMWYADFGDNSIGRVSLAGKITEYADGLNGPNGIVTGPDGALWFTETTGQQIGRITTSGSISHFGSAERYPQAITNGPDGALWFTAFGRVARITTSGSITHFKLGGSRTEFEGIATGSDGALWVTQFVVGGSRFGHDVFRLMTNGMKTQFRTGSGPEFITAGPDGALWLTDNGAGKIGRFARNGQLTEFRLPSGLSPVGIAAGPDGALWFTAAPYIGRITVSGRIALYAMPPSSCSPQQIAPGPDRAMWFTCGDEIGRITTE